MNTVINFKPDRVEHVGERDEQGGQQAILNGQKGWRSYDPGQMIIGMGGRPNRGQTPPGLIPIRKSAKAGAE